MSINDEIEELNCEIGALEYEIMLRKKEKHQLVMKKAQMILDKEDENGVRKIAIEEHEKEELNNPYIICSECGIRSKPIYLVKFKPIDNVQKEKHYCIVCLIDLKRYNSSSIVSYKEIKQD